MMRKSYYFYYRCLEHTETNIPGHMLYEKFEELLDLLSFSRAQVEEIKDNVNALLKVSVKDNSKVIEQSGHSADSYKEMEEYSSIDTDGNDYADIGLQSYPGIEIADDIDDEAIHGKNRHKHRKARTNRR